MLLVSGMSFSHELAVDISFLEFMADLDLRNPFIPKPQLAILPHVEWRFTTKIEVPI